MTEDNQALKIGDLDDGGVYVGKSAVTGMDLHAAQWDEPGFLTYEEALEVAARMSRQPGRRNAHVPTPEELDVNLYQNKDKGALTGTFNTGGLNGCYRSSAPYLNDTARVQRFDNGGRLNFSSRDHRLAVRLVW